MAEPGGPQSGTRDNGLRADRYVAIGDLDPRVADAALGTLRAEGIAAYAVPTPGARGGYLEQRLPTQPTDRLYVDEQRAETACDLLARGDEPDPDTAAGTDAESGAGPGPGAPSAAGDPEDLDVDAAWEQILLSLRTSDPDGRPWPASEDVTTPMRRRTDVVGDPAGGGGVPAHVRGPDVDDAGEHYVPPPPPPLPHLQLPTIICLLAIIGGIVIGVTGIDGGDLFWLGVTAIIAGAAGLVWRTKDGPPTDSGWDDGAVV